MLRDLIAFILVILAIVGLWGWVIYATMVANELVGGNIPFEQENAIMGRITLNNAMINANSYLAISCPSYIQPIVYGTLINCLAEKESTNNPDAFNEFDPITSSLGLLQFKEGTWKDYCVDKYGFLESEIWNGEKQRRCCDTMLQDNWNNIGHWKATYKFCR